MRRGQSDDGDECSDDSSRPGLEAETRDHRRTNRRQLAAIAVALAAALLLVAVPLGLAARSYQRGDAVATSVGASAVVDLGPVDADGTATGWAELTGRRLTIGTDNLAPLADGRSYELWLLDPGTDEAASDPVWVGSVANGSEFSVDGSVDLSLYRVVDISIEAIDGDAGHSGDSVLRGSLD